MTDTEAEAEARRILGFLQDENVNSASLESLVQLIAGNRRYAAEQPLHPHQSISRRAEVLAGQHPMAAILGCSDSRVPPGLLFDQGVGDLFTARVAGNVVDDAIIDSFVYAVENLGVPLIVVLGHQSCGAIQVTLEALAAGQDIEHHPNSLIRAIAPAARTAASRDGDPVKNTICSNIFLSIDRLRARAELARHIDSGSLRIVGAYYHHDTGEIEFLED